MFTEILQSEVWRKKLEKAGYRVIMEAWVAPKTLEHLVKSKK